MHGKVTACGLVECDVTTFNAFSLAIVLYVMKFGKQVTYISINNLNKLLIKIDFKCSYYHRNQ